MSNSIKINFENNDKTILSGRLEKTIEESNIYALFAHCFTCSKDIAAASRISRALTAHKINVLRFDFTGLGNSDGDFANTNFSSNMQDLISAADFLRREYEAPQLIIGHSLGGAAVLAAASQIPEAKGIVTIGSPYDPDHVFDNFKGSIEEINQKGESKVNLAGRQFKIKKQFLDDLSSQNQDHAISKLKKALLVFHSPQDTIVEIENAKKIYTSAKHPKSFISLDGADHLLSNPKDSEYVAQTIASWGSRYLDFKEIKPLDSSVEVVGNKGTLTQSIYSGSHLIYSDEPKNLGGKDLGLSPYELLLAGLGSCTSMTLFMYAKHKKWELDSVKVKLNHDRIYAKDCADCEQKTGKLDIISREITLIGDLDSEKRQRLLEIADKCPVHKTLSNNPMIKTTAVKID